MADCTCGAGLQGVLTAIVPSCNTPAYGDVLATLERRGRALVPPAAWPHQWA